MADLPPTLEFLSHLWRLNHALERRSAQMQEELGVTAQQRMVLRCIGCLPAITPGELADVLHVDAGTLSATLRRLEQRKLVRRRRDTADSRRTLLSLTAAGRRYDRPSAISVEAAAAALLGEKPRAEITRVTNVLRRFADVLDGDR